MKDPQAGRKTMATWGIVLSCIAIGLGIFGAVVVENAIDDVDEATRKLERDLEGLDSNP